MTKTIAPGKIILFGEHAVVYDIPGIAAAIDLQTKAEVGSLKGKKIHLKDPWREVTIEPREIEKLTKQLDELIEQQKFEEITKLFQEDKGRALKYVIGSALTEIKPFSIRLDTELRKGMGTSASLAASTALALSDFFSLGLDKQRISELTYNCDVVAHGGTPSGIDNSTVVFGGYILYQKSAGVNQLNIDRELPIVIGDTGSPAQTAKTVPMVRKLREKDEEVAEAITKVGEVTKQAKKEIKSGSLEEVGRLMDLNQELLRIMQVSSPELEQLIKAAKDAGAYGAKLSGGGVGGIMIAIGEDTKKISNAIEKAGGEAIITKLGVDGVKLVDSQ